MKESEQVWGAVENIIPLPSSHVQHIPGGDAILLPGRVGGGVRQWTESGEGLPNIINDPTIYSGRGCLTPISR